MKSILLLPLLLLVGCYSEDPTPAPQSVAFTEPDEGWFVVKGDAVGGNATNSGLVAPENLVALTERYIDEERLFSYAQGYVAGLENARDAFEAGRNSGPSAYTNVTTRYFSDISAYSNRLFHVP